MDSDDPYSFEDPTDYEYLDENENEDELSISLPPQDFSSTAATLTPECGKYGGLSFCYYFHFPDIISELIIEAVRASPSLWNIHHDEYKNKIIRTKSWEEVAKEAGKSLKCVTKVHKSTKFAYLF